MNVEVTTRCVVDNQWLEVGEVYDLPAHRAKELFDSARGIPARSKPPESAVEIAPESVMEQPAKVSRRRGKK